jgi:hypothetical protein
MSKYFILALASLSVHSLIYLCLKYNSEVTNLGLTFYALSVLVTVWIDWIPLIVARLMGIFLMVAATAYERGPFSFQLLHDIILGFCYFAILSGPGYVVADRVFVEAKKHAPTFFHRMILTIVGFLMCYGLVTTYAKCCYRF